MLIATFCNPMSRHAAALSPLLIVLVLELVLVLETLQPHVAPCRRALLV